VTFGSAGGLAVEVWAIGIGGLRLPKEVPPGVGCVILAGFGGALDPALKVGDVIVDWPGEGSSSVAPVGPFRAGRIHCARAIVATAAEKAALFETTGAGVVEMEGDAVRNLLAPASVPLVGVRAITDTADEALDPTLVALVDEIGRPKPLALAGLLARHPSRIASLRRLGAAAQLAGRRLGEAVSSLVRSDELKRLLESR
jgi:hypothetical protein